MFINSSSKIHIIQPNFTWKPGLRICKTNISAYKIDESKLKIFRIIIASFQEGNKDENSCFIEKTFLPIEIIMDYAFGMLFFSWSKVKIYFKN